MKRLLIFFLLTQSFQVMSQTYNERSALLEIGYGVAIPFGKFEASDVNDSASGYATSGTNLNVIFTYMVNKKIGVSAMISSSVNKLNEGGVKNKFNEYAGRISNDAVVSDIQLAKWNTTAYLAGAQFIQPLQKAAFNVQMLFGYSRTEFPESNVIVYKDTSIDPITVDQYAESVASAFCFNIGAGLKYNISDIMCINVNANYFSSNPEFDDVKTIGVINGNTEEEVYSYHQRVSLLNVTVGLGFRF
jgi:hypothetical protein